MTREEIRKILGWCSVINIGLFIASTVGMRLMHDAGYQLFGQGFGLSAESFDALQFEGLIIYKICILVFNVVPYIAMRILKY